MRIHANKWFEDGDEAKLDIESPTTETLLTRLLNVTALPIHYSDTFVCPSTLRNAVLSVEPSAAGFFTVCMVYSSGKPRYMTVDPLTMCHYSQFESNLFQLLHTFGISIKDTNEYAEKHTNERMNAMELQSYWSMVGAFAYAPPTTDAEAPIPLPDDAKRQFEPVEERTVFHRLKVLQKLLDAADANNPLARKAIIPIALAAKVAVETNFFDRPEPLPNFAYIASLFDLPLFEDPLIRLCQYVRMNGFRPRVGLDSSVAEPTLV